MAEGENYLERLGHSQDRVTPCQSDSGNGPITENSGYYVQPTSTGIERVDTDGESLISHDVQSLVNIYERRLPNYVSFPPILRPTADAPLEHYPSASGFSNDRMNVPSHGHLQQLTSTNMSVQAELEQDRGNAQNIRELELSSLEDTPRSAAVGLNDILALVRNQDKVTMYRTTIQLLKDANISEDAILDVVIDYGVTSLTSRSKFFAKYDNADDVSSVSSTQSRLSNIENRSMASPSLECGSDFSTNVTHGSHAGPRHPEYEDSNTRLQSYKSCPFVNQTKEELSAAGLFYTGREDICSCFNCGVSIMKWKTDDNPIKEHFRLQPDCQFARQVYVQTHCIAFEASPDQSSRDTLENWICPVCFAYEVSVSQHKCGHIVCPRCVPKRTSDGAKRYCPITWCRREIEATTPYDRAAMMNAGQ